MNKKELLNKIPEEVIRMSNKGLYSLFVSKDILIVKDEVDVFSFSLVSGEYIKTDSAKTFDLSYFERISLVTKEEVKNLLNQKN